MKNAHVSLAAIHRSASLPRASPGRADLHRRVVVFPAQPRRARRSVFWDGPICFLLAEFLILRGRIYYLAPIYPMLFAAGAVAIEAWIGILWQELGQGRGPCAAGGWGTRCGAAGPADSSARCRGGVREFLGRGPRAGGKRAERKIAADVCRHDGLAATGGSRRRRVSLAFPGRSIAGRDPRQKLRAGRRDRLFWPGAGPPARHQRAQQLLFVGTPAIHRGSGHRSGDAARGFETAIRPDRTRRNNQQRVRDSRGK